MTDMILAPALMPDNTRTYFADVPLRLWDPGKWSDVEKFLDLIGGGAVINLCGRLRLWGSTDPFNGIVTSVRALHPTIHGGRVIVRAGADPSFNANCTVEQLVGGSFDHNELALCVLSTIDFSRITPCDLEITVVAPIPPGASLGTSAALGVAIERAFLGSAHDSLKIAERALFAEKEISGRKTGRQDHDAAANGSHCDVWTPAIMIEMRSLWEATITPIRIGPNVASWLKHTVVTYLGSHDSSDIHQALMAELEGDSGAAEVKLTRIRQTAELARKALEKDDTTLFAQACQALLDAQRGLSQELIGGRSHVLIETARHFDGVSCVPGAGGNGGSLISCFPSRKQAESFVFEAQKAGSYRFYEVEYPGLKYH